MKTKEKAIKIITKDKGHCMTDHYYELEEVKKAIDTALKERDKQWE